MKLVVPNEQNGPVRNRANSVLAMALEELKLVRTKLKTCKSATDVANALRQAESGLLSRSKESPYLVAEAAHPDNESYCQLSVKPHLPSNIGCKGKKHRKDAYNTHEQNGIQQRFIENPQSAAALQYLKECYHVNYPVREEKKQPQSIEHTFQQPLIKGLTTAHPMILPKWIRDDPFEIPPIELTSCEIKKGILHLLGRGLITCSCDIEPLLSDGSWAMRSLKSCLHPYSQRYGKKYSTTALEDSLLANESIPMKLDTSTPVVMPKASLGRDENSICRPQNSAQDGFTGTIGRDDPRVYSDLMDTHSLHHFLIRNGSLVDGTPKFASFRRTYSSVWIFVSDMILQLEAIFQQYAVPLALINGKDLAETATASMITGELCTMEDLLACVENIQEVALVLKQPGRRFLGLHGKEQAAIMIQCYFRGFKSRMRHARISTMRGAAVLIQTTWRLYCFRKEILTRMSEAQKSRCSAFQRLQGALFRDWDSLHLNPHVVVHIPSVSGNDMKLLQKEHTSLLQMARLCDIADSNVDVIYVATTSIDREVEEYWTRLLEIKGIENPQNRYRIVHPENFERLPCRMSLTSKLLSSPRCLQRIRNFIHGRKGYLIPGIVGEEEVDLCVALNIPLMAPHPHLRQMTMSKSGSIALFGKAGIRTGPSRALPCIKNPYQNIEKSPLTAGTEFSISTTGELIITESTDHAAEERRARRPRNDGFLIRKIADVVIENFQWRKWSIAVENEVWGRGVAFFDLINFDDTHEILARLLDRASEPSKREIDAARQAVIVSITKLLPKKLKIVRKDLYPSYRDFVRAIRSHGGLLQAVPNLITGYPLVNIFVPPVGIPQLVSTHEQVYCPTYVPVGSSFPQCSVPHTALFDTALHLGNVCQLHGIIGHISLSLLVLRDQGSLEMWARDLFIGPSPSLSSYKLFHFLSAGQFDARTGRYMVPEGTEGHLEMLDEEKNMSCQVEDAQASHYFKQFDNLNHTGPPNKWKSATDNKRFYVSIHGLKHPLLQKLHYTSFFHCCRVHGMCFDAEDRIGTAFDIVDDVVNGALGVLCVGASAFEAFDELGDVLDFVSGQVISSKNKDLANGAGNNIACTLEDTIFERIRATINFLAGKLKSCTHNIKQK